MKVLRLTPHPEESSMGWRVYTAITPKKIIKFKTFESLPERKTYTIINKKKGWFTIKYYLDTYCTPTKTYCITIADDFISLEALL